MIESIHSIWLVLLGLLALIFGAVGGFLLSKIRYHQEKVELEKKTQKLKEKRIEIQRLAYQVSTSTFHRKSGEEDNLQPGSERALEELLAQREHELSILQQESQLEIRILQERNEALQNELDELKEVPYPYLQHVEPGLFSDVPDSLDDQDAQNGPNSQNDEDVLDNEEVLDSEDVLDNQEVLDNEDVLDDQEVLNDAAEDVGDADNDKPEKRPESQPEKQHVVEDQALPDVQVYAQKSDEGHLTNTDVNSDEVNSTDEFAFHWTAPPSLTMTAPASDGGISSDEEDSNLEEVDQKVEAQENGVIEPETPEVGGLGGNVLKDEAQENGSPNPVEEPPMQASMPIFQRVVSFVPPPSKNQEVEEGQPSRLALPGLGPDQSELLLDLGFATPEKIASLSEEEITRLSSIFRIPDTVIRSEWITAAQQFLAQ